MRVSAFFELPDVELYGIYLGVDLGIVLGNDLQFLAFFQDGDFSIFEVDYAVGVFDDGGGVGGQEKLVLANTDGQWAALSGSNDGVGIPAVENGYGVGADYLVQGQLHGGKQVEVVRHLDILDELYKHLGVGAAFEGISFVLQFLFDGGIVFDDAVVYQSQIARCRVMGVCVDLVGLSVSGPAGMCNAYVPCCVLAFGQMSQVGHFAFGLIDIQFICVIYKSDSGTVVAPVFQSF